MLSCLPYLNFLPTSLSYQTPGQIINGVTSQSRLNVSPIDCTVLFCCRGTHDGRAGSPKDQVQAAVPQPQQRVFKEAAAFPVTNAPLKIVSQPPPHH